VQPTTLQNLLGGVFRCRRFLKYACHWGVHGDACCGGDTDDVAPGEEDVVRIICIQGKRPGIVVSVSTQDDIFNDLGGPPWGPDLGRFRRIDNVTQGEVIELVFGSSGPFPYPQQKSPFCVGRPEFMISVPSRCHWVCVQQQIKR
jgi:hypothetical protein